MIDPRGRFTDRREAGRLLAAALADLAADRPIVLALPRGGVPVAYEVARALGARLDVLLVRKIGAPGQAELGIGAIVEGAPPRVILNEELVRRVGASPSFLAAAEAHERAELERRRQLYRGGRDLPPLSGRTIILVDDGIATGSTVRAALEGLGQANPARLVLAAPVAPPETLARLRPFADEIVTLIRPPDFTAVGAFYENFDQTSDAEVLDLLRDAFSSREGGGSSP